MSDRSPTTGLACPVRQPPSPGLIASLGVRAWPEMYNDGRLFAPLLITHPPALRDGEGGEVIEQRMRSVAASLGLLPPSALVPDCGPRVAILPRGGALLRFDGTTYAMRLPVHGHYAAILARLGRVLLAVGFDPLSTGASRTNVDSYVQTSVSAGRMRFGSAGVVAARDAYSTVHRPR